MLNICAQLHSRKGISRNKMNSALHGSQIESVVNLSYNKVKNRFSPQRRFDKNQYLIASQNGNFSKSNIFWYFVEVNKCWNLGAYIPYVLLRYSSGILYFSRWFFVHYWIVSYDISIQKATLCHEKSWKKLRN